MKKLIYILATIFALSTAGCVMGPDFVPPEFQTPDTYRFSESQTQAWTNPQWCQLFNDPALELLVTATLENNKDLLIAAARIQQARASVRFVRADQLPRVDVEAGASRGTYWGERKSLSIEENFFVAPTLTWELDFWGKFRRASEAEQAEYVATEYAFCAVRVSLISEVVSTYFLLLDFQQRLQISERTLDTRLKSLDIIEKRFVKGIIPEIDLNQAQIQKEDAAASIPRFQRAIAITENALSILLGRLPAPIATDTNLTAQLIPPDIPPGLPCSLLQRRPDILQAEYQLKAQNARIGIAQALRLPAIGLTGILGGASDQLKDLTSGGAAWSVQTNIFSPVFNFDQDKMRVEFEKARTKELVYNYENTALTAFAEVEDALIEIATYREELVAVGNKLVAAKNAARLSYLRYDKGVTSFLEVLDTERVLFAVELDKSELDQLYLTSYVRLFKALGGGWQTTH